MEQKCIYLLYIFIYFIQVYLDDIVDGVINYSKGMQADVDFLEWKFASTFAEL